MTTQKNTTKLTDFLENHLNIKKGQQITIAVSSNIFTAKYISTNDFLNAIFLETETEKLLIPYKRIRFIKVEKNV